MHDRRGGEKREDDAGNLHPLGERAGGDEPVPAGEGVVGAVPA